MAKNTVNDYDTTASNNTDIQSVNIAEGCAPSNINNAIRELMADVGALAQGGVTATSIKAAAFSAQTATITSLVLGTGTYTAIAGSRQVIAGAGLSGGGALSSDVTLALDVSDLTATATTVRGADYLPIYRTAATGTYKALLSTIVPAGDSSTAGIWAGATQAQMVAGTETAVVVTPSVQAQYPSHPKAWGNLDGTGSINLRAGAGVSSVTDLGTGSYRFNWATAFSGNDLYAVTAGVQDSTTLRTVHSITNLLAASATIAVGRTDTQAATDTDVLCIDAYGAH